MDAGTERTEFAVGASVLLTSPAFVLAVAMLALNDWVLKSSSTLGGNWWTGKLSDVAGLFAFPLFWAAFLPARWRRGIYGATAVGFLVWKSPFSGPALATWNGLGLWPVARVVDYSDLLALLALVPSYRLARSRFGAGSTRCPDPAPAPAYVVRRRVKAVATATFAVAAFTATSRAATMDLRRDEGFAFAASRSDVRAQLDSVGHAYVHGPRTGPVDTLVVSFSRSMTAVEYLVLIELRSTADGGSAITLLRTRSMARPSDVATLRREFEAQIITPLRARLVSRPPAPGD